MFCTHMLVQLHLGDEALRLAAIGGTFVTPEAKRAMNAVFVLSQCAGRVVSCIALFIRSWVDMCARVWCKLEVV